MALSSVVAELLGVIYFLDFSCSLCLCVAVSVFEVADLSLSLYWLPLDGTDRWCCYMRGFLDFWMGGPLPLFLFSLVEELMFLLVPRAHRSGCWKSLFCFLEGSVIHSSNCNFSLTCTPWSTLLQILQLLGLLSLPPHSGACHRMGGGVGLALGVLGMPTDPAERSLSGVLPETHGQTSCWSPEAVCRNRAPFMPLIFLPASFTSSSLPSIMEVPPPDCWYHCVTPTVRTAQCFPLLHGGGCPLQQVLSM